MKPATYLILPDIHAPFENKAAFKLVRKVAKALKPDGLVSLGDLADCAAVSSFPRDATERGYMFHEEVSYANDEILDSLDSLGIKRRHLILGNHEYRLKTYIRKNAPELAGLKGLSAPELFNLEKRGWGWTEYNDALRIGRLWLTHDDGACGPLAHAKARDSFQGNVVIGHTHNLGVSYQGNAHGVSHFGAALGWLGDDAKIDYTKRWKAKRWQLGFGVARFLPNGNVHLQVVPLVDGMCIVDGVKVT